MPLSSGRKDRMIFDRQEMEELLFRSPVGQLGLVKDSFPYVVPVNFLYDDGCIYLHSGLQGTKIGILRNNPCVCFLVEDHGPQVLWERGCGISQIYKSVICFGCAKLVEDKLEKIRILEKMIQKYVPQKYSKTLNHNNIDKTAVVKISVETMTCKANALNSKHEIVSNQFKQDLLDEQIKS